MPLWQQLVRKPPDLCMEAWSCKLARQLLQGAQLVVGGNPHRLVEIEFYCRTDAHPDPFPHCHPVQRQPGRWYFHRTGNAYRGGSFKGLDLTISAGNGFGGLLIRSIETPDGKFIVGPSLCVDYFLAQSHVKTIAELDAAIGAKSSWDTSNPLFLQMVPIDDRYRIFRSARVGLSLKKASRSAESVQFIMRPYRFLTEPRRIKKGKLHLVLALHKEGVSIDQIAEITGSSRVNIQRYIREFEIGCQEGDSTPYIGIDLGPRELCRLHGVWHSQVEAQVACEW